MSFLERMRQLTCSAILILLLTACFSEWLRPPLLLVGNLTIDVVEGKKALGGAISYAAAVASAYGVQACIVTAAGPDADLSVFKGHELHLVPANQTLTFEHTYTWWGNNRKLRVTAQPNVTLTPEHVPRRCQRARTVLLGPLTPTDLAAAAFVQHQQGWWDAKVLRFRQAVGYMAQGEQRLLDKSGKVVPFKAPSARLEAALSDRTSVFLSDVETGAWPKGTVPRLAARSARWLVTRGELGADEVTADGTVLLPPEKVTAVDTNGAGDSFATAYMLSLATHHRSPGHAACWAASRAVTMPQACKPQCVTDSIRRELWPARPHVRKQPRLHCTVVRARAPASCPHGQEAHQQQHFGAADPSQLPLPPGSLGLPLIGETVPWVRQPMQFYKERQSQHGGVFKTNFLLENTVIVYGDAAIRRLLQSEHKLVESAWPFSIQKLLGPGSLITQQGQKHTSQRRIMSQAFTKDAVHAYVPAINKCVDMHLSRAAGSGQYAGWEASRRLAFDVAATTLLGFHFKDDTARQLRKLYDTYVFGFFGLPNPLPNARFGKALKARRQIRGIISDYIKQAVAAAKSSKEPATEALGTSKEVANVMRLCIEAQDEQGRTATLDELTDQCLTQLFAGHETTGIALCRLLLLLPEYPKVLQGLRLEQQRLQQRYGDSITGPMLDDMTYADAVLKEQLRRHPIVPALWRRTLNDIDIDGFRIPKGWRVQLMMGAAMANIPEWKDTADEFMPERWLDEQGRPTVKEPTGYTPWGDGARKCIGMRLARTELKAVLAPLLRGFQWEQADPEEKWSFIQKMKPVEERFMLNMRPLQPKH